jgi:hypothetical protein
VSLPRMKRTATAITVTLTTTTATSTVLTAGRYEVDNDGIVDAYIKQGGSAVTAVIASSPRLPAGSSTLLDVDDSTDAYVAGITSAGTTTLRIARVT